MVFNDKIEPPTWVLSDMVQAAGAKGILFPSMAKRIATRRSRAAF